MEDITIASGKLADAPFIDDTPKASMSDLRSRARRLRERGLSFL